MKVAFKKVNYKHPFSLAIAIFTASALTHVELAFEEYPLDSEGRTLCFSSSEEDGGTRFKRILLDDGWLILPLRETQEQLRTAMDYARSKTGLPYDWLGILGFVHDKDPSLPLDTSSEHDPDTRFCSEIVTEILQHTFGWWSDKKPWKISPGDLYNMLRFQLDL